VQKPAGELPGRDGSGPGRGPDTVAKGSTDSPPARSRLRAFLRRHQSPLLFTGGILLALAVMLGYQANQPPPREFVQEDIDAAVLHTLENNVLPSPAVKAYEAVQASVVSVQGFGPPGKPALASSQVLWHFHLQLCSVAFAT
jgi:hypothetical protein